MPTIEATSGLRCHSQLGGLIHRCESQRLHPNNGTRRSTRHHLPSADVSPRPDTNQPDISGRPANTDGHAGRPSHMRKPVQTAGGGRSIVPMRAGHPHRPGKHDLGSGGFPGVSCCGWDRQAGELDRNPSQHQEQRSHIRQTRGRDADTRLDAGPHTRRHLVVYSEISLVSGASCGWGRVLTGDVVAGLGQLDQRHQAHNVKGQRAKSNPVSKRTKPTGGRRGQTYSAPRRKIPVSMTFCDRGT